MSPAGGDSHPQVNRTFPLSDAAGLTEDKPVKYVPLPHAAIRPIPYYVLSFQSE